MGYREAGTSLRGGLYRETSACAVSYLPCNTLSNFSSKTTSKTLPYWFFLRITIRSKEALVELVWSLVMFLDDLGRNSTRFRSFPMIFGAADALTAIFSGTTFSDFGAQFSMNFGILEDFWDFWIFLDFGVCVSAWGGYDGARGAQWHWLSWHGPS